MGVLFLQESCLLYIINAYMHKKKFSLSSWWLGVIIFVGIVFFLAAYFYGFSNPSRPERIREYMASFGVWAPGAYIAIIAFLVLFLIPALPVTIAGGALFGTFEATFYSVIGGMIGCVIAFSLARKYGKGILPALKRNGFEQLAEYDEKIAHNGFVVVLFLRLVPLIFSSALNYAFGWTKVRFRDYFWGTLIGSIPGTIAFAYFGESIATLHPLRIGGAIIVLAIFSGGIFMFKKRHESAPPPSLP